MDSLIKEAKEYLDCVKDDWRERRSSANPEWHIERAVDGLVDITSALLHLIENYVGENNENT